MLWRRLMRWLRRRRRRLRLVDGFGRGAAGTGRRFTDREREEMATRNRLRL